MKFSLENFKKAWDNRGDILDGVKNSIFVNNQIEALYEERNEICKSNVCGYYDPEGRSEAAVFPGERSCAACGCKLEWKLRAPGSNCGLEVKGKTPLWRAVI